MFYRTVFIIHTPINTESSFLAALLLNMDLSVLTQTSGESVWLRPFHSETRRQINSSLNRTKRCSWQALIFWSLQPTLQWGVGAAVFSLLNQTETRAAVDERPDCEALLPPAVYVTVHLNLPLSLLLLIFHLILGWFWVCVLTLERKL